MFGAESYYIDVESIAGIVRNTDFTLGPVVGVHGKTVVLPHDSNRILLPRFAAIQGDLKFSFGIAVSINCPICIDYLEGRIK